MHGVTSSDASELIESAVELDAVSFTYAGAATPAVQSVSLRVQIGERLGILGPNGGGKTTLLKLIMGLQRAQQGRVRVMGLDPVEARHRGLIGYVPQRAEAELGFPLSVRQVVALGATWRLWPWQGAGGAIADRVTRALALVGAESFAEKPIGALSGGQLQRALIARALAGLRPQGAGTDRQWSGLLVLDEPTVGIDAAGQQQFAELLKSVHERAGRNGTGRSGAGQNGSGLTTLIVSHDIRAVAAGSDRVACLSRTLHYHDSPSGLTPQVLAEVFSHDVAGLAGFAAAGPLAGMHVHAHGPGEACPHEHASEHASKHDAGHAAGQASSHAHEHQREHAHEHPHAPPRPTLRPPEGPR